MNEFDSKEEIQEEVITNKYDEPKQNIAKILLKQFGPIFLYALLCFVTVKLTANMDDISIFKEKNNHKDFSIIDISTKSTGYIKNNEIFIVKTKDGSVEELQNHLYLEPPLNYTIKENKKNEYSVIVNDIPSNTLLNLNYVNNEIVDYRWAFQSIKDMGVTSIYPTDNATEVSPYTSIEINLSYADVKDLDKYVTITPEVKGTFQNLGRTWIFKPNDKLQENTTYEITVNKGYTNGTYTSEESYKSKFSTYKINYVDDDKREDYQHYSSITEDNINTFLPGEKPIFKLYSYKDAKPKNIKIFKFKNLDNFIKYLNNDKDYKVDELGDYTFESIYRDCYILNQELEVGYYLEQVSLDDNKTIFNIPVQINELAAYALSTPNDILVWVGSGNELQKDINVKYNDRSTKTNSDGIATIKNYNNRNNKLEYVFVGDNNPLVVGIKNNQYIDYPSAYLYTDKPLYKNTDKIHLWGFIPISFYEDKVDETDFSLSFDDKNIPISISKDGTFETEIDLDNMVDNYYYFSLSYKNVQIGGHGIEVLNYEKQNYIYNINYDKNILAKGEKFSFDINVKHVTGINVPNKEVTIVYNKKEYRTITNEKGNAHFEITPVVATNSTSPYNYDSVAIKNSAAEYNDYIRYVGFVVVDKYVATEDYLNYKENKKIEGTIVNIDPHKYPNYNNNELIKVLKTNNYNGTIKVQLKETKSTRYQSGTWYNSYTKTYEPTYNYNRETSIIKEESISVTDGVLSYSPNVNFKETTEEINYYYEAIILIPDGKGNTLENNVYLYNYDAENNNTYSKGYVSNNGGEGSEYDVYRYYMDIMYKKYSIDDQMNFILKDYNKIDIKEANKVLEIKFKNSIINTKIYDNTEDVTNIFTNKDVPGIEFTASFFKDGHFYRLPTNYYDFNEEDRKLNVEIKTDKKDYKPQEEVKVTINTKDKNNNGTKTRVLVSVVDEKIFQVEDDYTNILETIYSDIYYPSYTYSTFRDYELFNDGGGAGSTDGHDRVDFGDTLLFKEVETDNNGKAEIKFKLNDSITSFRITVHAINDDNYVGVNKANVNSTLPLAIEFTIPRGLKETDDVVLNASSIGTVNSNIEYEFTIKDIKNKITKSAILGNTVYANFGKLPVGKYKASISAKSSNKSDKVSYEFEVIKKQQEITKKETYNINDKKDIKPKKNPVTLEFYRKSMKDNMYFLDILKETHQDRLDTIISYYKSLEIDNKYYKKESPIETIDINRFKNDKLLKYLPAEEYSLVLTALVSYYSPSIFKADATYITKELSKKTQVEDAIDYYLILSALKQPVLDDIKYIIEKYPDVSSNHKLELILSLCFLGDYNYAKELTVDTNDADKGLIALISTFIDKKEAKNNINKVYQEDISNRYLYFAIMSYLANNSIDISNEEELTVTYGKTVENIKLNGLNIARITINDKDLKDIKFSSKYKDIMVDYYYEGELKQSDNVIKDINITLENNNLKLFKNTYLSVDISKITNAGILKIYLPNSMKLSGITEYKKGIYLSSNQIDYLTYYISKEHDNTLKIPIYISSPGSYHIEEIIFKINDTYHISNGLDINIEE